jgi:hypothetical protein
MIEERALQSDCNITSIDMTNGRSYPLKSQVGGERERAGVLNGRVVTFRYNEIPCS